MRAWAKMTSKFVNRYIPVRHLLSLMCQSEVYWLSKQRILFFWDWQNLNIKRLFCKQWIATTWHYLPCKFTWNIPTNLLTLGQRTLRKLGELSSLFIFYNILYNITISLLYALISGHPGGVDPGDIQGNSAGFAGYCRQYLAQDGGIGPLLPFRGKIHGERPAGFVTSPPSWKWKIRTSGTASKMALEKLKNCDRPARLLLFAKVYSDLFL